MPAGGLTSAGIALATTFFALIASSGPLFGQEPPRRDSAREAADSARVVPLAAIHVTVTRRAESLQRVAQAVSIVSAADVQGPRPMLGLDESLALVPGVVAANRYNFSLGTRLSIRGFGSRAAFGVRGVRILEDGIPLTSPDGQANLTNFDPGTTGRIEVLRGPSSALYGNAAGGVIAIESAPPPDAPLAGRARLVLGDYGADTRMGNLARWQAQAGGRAGAADYSASISHADVDGFREHAHVRLTLFNGGFGYSPDSVSRLRFVLNVASQPLAESPGALPLDSARLRPRMAWPTSVSSGAGEADLQAQAGVAYTRSFGHAQLQATIYGLNRTVDNALPFGVIDINRHAGGARGSIALAGQILRRDAELTAGVDADAQRDARREFAAAGAGQRGAPTRDQLDRVASVGPFLQAQIGLAARLRLDAGVRYDAVRFTSDDRFLANGDNSGARTLTALSPKTSLLFAAGGGATVYATVATSFQTPTTTELINAPPAPGQPCCAGGFNPDLSPEHALSYEAGLRGAIAGRLRYDVAAFSMAVRDEIVAFRVPQVPDRDFYRNAARSLHRGLEVGADAPLTPWLRLALAYTWSRFTFVDDGLPDKAFQGNHLPGVPPQRLVGRLTVRARGVDAEAQADHVARYFVDDANTASNPAYTVVDLRVQARRAFPYVGVAPFVALENAFDVRYNSSVVVNAVAGRYYEPAPGRHLLLGLALPIGDWGS